MRPPFYGYAIVSNHLWDGWTLWHTPQASTQSKVTPSETPTRLLNHSGRTCHQVRRPWKNGQSPRWNVCWDSWFFLKHQEITCAETVTSTSHAPITNVEAPSHPTLLSNICTTETTICRFRSNHGNKQQTKVIWSSSYLMQLVFTAIEWLTPDFQ